MTRWLVVSIWMSITARFSCSSVGVFMMFHVAPAAP